MSEPQLRYPKLSRIRSDVGFYRHQVEGINRLMTMQNFLLADEMGLGKSLQALTVAAIDVERGVADRILIVCVNSIKYNWLDEIELHTTFKAMVLDGKVEERVAKMDKFIDEGYEILITNYEMVVKHVIELNALEFDIIILDEAHAIKNPKAKRTIACFGLIAHRYFLLTGSPLLNRVNELWSLLHRIDPAQFPKYWRFVSRYCVFGGYEGREIVGTKNQKELREKIGPLMLRRLKKDVLDLPEKQRYQEWLDMRPEQRKMYRTALEELRVDHPVTNMTLMEINQTITRYGRLSQICSTTANLADEDYSVKLDRLVELVPELIDSGESVVVFCRYRGTIQSAWKRLNDLGFDVYQMHGDVQPEERQDRIRRWTVNTNKGKPGVLLSMMQVGGVGLNLSAASTVIFVDRLEVPKLNDQAIDRVHRIGVNMTKPVRAIELLCRASIDRRVEQLIKRKDVVFEDVIEGANYDNHWKRKLIEAMQEDEEDG